MKISTKPEIAFPIEHINNKKHQPILLDISWSNKLINVAQYCTLSLKIKIIKQKQQVMLSFKNSDEFWS